MIPALTLFIALVEDHEIAKAEEDLKVLPLPIRKIVFAFADHGLIEVMTEADVDDLRSVLDATGVENVELITGDRLVATFYGAIVGDWLVRVEPWCPACLYEGWGPFRKRPMAVPKSEQGLLKAYKQEAAFRRDKLSTGHIDGPPDGYDTIVLEAWTVPNEEGRREGYTALSIEVWKA